MPLLSTSKLELTMRDAPDYKTWRKAAIEHDRVSGKNLWRSETKSPLYDYQAIEQRLKSLRKLRADNDHRGLLFTLNQGIHGNIGGMGSAKLYRQSRFGTKDLIAAYIEETVSALEHLSTSRTRTINFEERYEFFKRANHCFGQSALMLSGGASLAYFHVGVAKALCDESLLPTVISGSSGGAIVAGVLGTHTDDELDYFFDPANLVTEAKNEASWLSRIITLGAPRYHVEDLEAMVARIIPDVTFAEAFEISGRSINISIAPNEPHQSSRLLNAVTSPNVMVRSAIMASSAVPGIFPPVTLEAKTIRGNSRRKYLPSRKWIDGSVSEDLPVKRLARLYGVNHYIASQVNPLVLWVLQDPKASQGIISTGLGAMIRSSQEWLRATQPLTHKMIRSMPKVEYMYRTVYSLMTQQYTGDITLKPRSRYFNPTRLLSPLTEQELMTLITEGQQVTYPKLEMIRNCTRISSTLQKIVKLYEEKAMKKGSISRPSKRAHKPAA